MGWTGEPAAAMVGMRKEVEQLLKGALDYGLTEWGQVSGQAYSGNAWRGMGHHTD